MEQTDWSRVQVGDIVHSAKDGHDWAVMEIDGIQFTIEREGKRPVVGNFTGPVTLSSSARDVMDSAVLTVQEELGGVVLHAEEDGKPPYCPPDYEEPGPLMAHLYLLHGVRYDGVVEESPLRDLLAMHKAAHDQKGDGYVHHHHDPEFRTRNA